ncbi:hypothetical protein HDV02_000057 [Globomyces sp. JEL0801]|nr:hypothetical protein HDV02_000057 [Globomyces sp. JEL0801]
MLLQFHKDVICSMSSGSESQINGLVIMAKGLGIHKIISTFLQIHADPRNLILLLNTSTFELEEFRKAMHDCDELDELSQTQYLREVTQEIPAKEREAMYLSGGVISITTRIFVVDLLNGVVPTEMITGIIINHAERVTDTSTIAFILRLYRQANKQGFIKAFSEEPMSFTGELNKLERMMKVLQLRHVHIWPRFHQSVIDSLDSVGHVELIEIRTPLTKSMKNIQSALLECINQSLIELKRLHSHLDIDEINFQSSLFRSFDQHLRQQLESVWHKTSSKTKELVNDLKTMRNLLFYLVSYDAVTFHSYLETIRAAHATSLKSGFKGSMSSWLLLDAANIVFNQARSRVFQKSLNITSQDPKLPNGYKITLEEQPKWKIFMEVLHEIEIQRRTDGSRENDGNSIQRSLTLVLILVHSGRTAIQIREIISKSKIFSNTTNSDSTENGFTNNATESLLKHQLQNYFKWKNDMGGLIPQTTSTNIENSGRHQSKRRRIRGSSNTNNQPKTSDTTNGDEIMQLSECFSLDEQQLDSVDVSLSLLGHIHCRCYSDVDGSSTGLHDSNSNLLENIKPRWVIMYDPNVAFVRRLEVYKAENPNLKLKVYFLIYDNAVEEQQYLATLRKEKESFERLIFQKSSMVIPIDEQGNVVTDGEELFWKEQNSRIAGGQSNGFQKKVLVDVREFRSNLPFLLHARRMQIVPCTIEIGDYILSPDLCVERKSLSDLTQSLNSGRLYKQIQAMSLMYKDPILLIEFKQSSTFELVMSPADKDIDIARKLVLVSIHFPNLRIIWSCTPAATAEVFEDLQRDKSDPDLEVAQNSKSFTDHNISEKNIPELLLRYLELSTK